jgi:hypothetical protein
MIEQGFIGAKDFNLNILQGPKAYRIDMLPPDIKMAFKQEFEDHIEWLRPQDPINRAVGGYEAAIQFMMAQDNQHLLPEFWETVMDMDWCRDESLLSVVPEVEQIIKYKPDATTTR